MTAGGCDAIPSSRGGVARFMLGSETDALGRRHGTSGSRRRSWRKPRNTLVSWIKILAFVRNTSAHHSRLWNAGIINQPLVPKPYEAGPLVHLGSARERRTRVYGAATVANYFVRRINPGSSWPGRMKAHWYAFPAMPFAGPAQGGFLPGWDAEAIWN